jgi:hypothetical protein
MANTRGKTHVHGPSATGTISAGSVSTAPAPGVHGSGANSGNRTTISPGMKAPAAGRAGNPTSGVPAGLNAGTKTTVGMGAKKPGYTSGAGVGANTPAKRKKQRRLGTNNGHTPA